VFHAFAESKRQYLAKLKAGQIDKPTAVDKLHQQVMEITGDPLPYGVAPNRKVIEELLRHATTQGIITIPVAVDDLFTPSTRGLVA
jgi:4,5-dihydroxyphthalate decarboxylase